MPKAKPSSNSTINMIKSIQSEIEELSNQAKAIGIDPTPYLAIAAAKPLKAVGELKAALNEAANTMVEGLNKLLKNEKPKKNDNKQMNIINSTASQRDEILRSFKKQQLNK